MEDCAPSIFLGSWALMALYLCVRFYIFDRPILKEYVFKLKRGPHLLESCLCATRDGFPPIAREMHPSFENLAVIDITRLHVYLMEIHHDTSLMFILEDDSISLVSRAYICSCLGEGDKTMVSC